MVLTVDDVKNYISRFEKAIKDPRKLALKKLDIAKLYREARNYEQAKQYAKEYVKINSNDHRAYNFLGNVCEDLTEWDEALKYYKKSIELQRTQKDILIKIVEMYSKMVPEDRQIAKVWADRAEQVVPNHSAIFNLKWQLLTTLPEKDYEQIEDLLAQNLMRNPRDPSLHVKLLEIYMDKGDYREAYTHCCSLLNIQLFKDCKELLMGAVGAIELFRDVTDDAREAAEALMAHIQVLCYLVNTTLKTSQLQSIKDAFYRLDEAVGKSFSFESSKLPSLTRSELDVFLSEARGQVYHHLAAILYKMALEGQMSWATASRLACVCFVISSSIHEPKTQVAWLHQKMPQESQKMTWHSMACLRLCQTDHLILSLEKEHGEEWISAAVADICTEAGKRVLIESVYRDMRAPKKSLLLMDKEFTTSDFELPSPERLLKYDEVAVTENPNNLSLTVWIGMNWHFIDNPLKTEALTFVNQMFEEIQFDVDDLKNCSPFTLSSLDLEVFVKAVVYTAVDKLIFSERENKIQFEPLLMPPVIGPPLCTSSQAEWWDAAFRLHTGKTWQVSTSKLKSILQRGLEAVRLVGNHGIDPLILKHISESFFSKADDILVTRDNVWRNQLQLECFKRRGYHFGNEALRILEINEGDRDVARPKAPLIPPLLKEIDDKERSEMIESLRMMLADASFRDDAPSDALNYLNGLFTADAAYKQAQIFRDLASKENIKNVEGLRNHLSFLRKSREKLQTCLGRLDKAQMIFREGVEAEIEEIRDAISEQSGISSAPSKVLDLRYSSADEDEQEDCQEDDQDDAATTTESKLVLENSILHEQLAVRNHEFSVLAARIHKLEREMSDMRANQSGNETVIKPRRDNSINTDESSSSVAYVPKDDVTSGSGNLTPRLEPEMSWDPFSPAPVFPVGFFSGLAETVEKIEEEPELETREAVEIGGNAQEKSVTEDKSSPGKSGREDASPGEGEDSYNDTLHVEPVVSLIKKSDVTTGEENEDVVFKEFAKIYRLSEGQWKERGTGFIKILKNRETKKTRILMRRDKVFIVCANHFLTSDMTITKKQGSSTTFVWYTAADSSEENPEPVTFAIRFKTEESANEFSKAFENNRTPVTGDANNLSTDVEIDEQKVSLEKSHEEATEKSSSEKPSVEVLEVDGKQAESGFKFDATKFTFKFGQNSSKEDTQVTEQTSQGSAEKVAVVSTPKLDFGPPGSKPTAGYSFGFDPSKIKFDFGKSPAATSNPETKEGTITPDNPFLAALQNSFVSSTSPGSLSFGRPDDAKPSNSPFTMSPFALQQDSPKASTPLTANASQMQKQVVFPSNLNTQDGQTSDLMPGDYINAAVQRGTQNANQGPGMASGHAAEQGRFLQGDWEAMQDRYYQDAAYDGSNQYYDDGGYYQNDNFYYDGEYYNGDDFYYGEENSYYANGDGDFEFYDQEPQRNLPTADSDSNSDRLTPQNLEGGEHVPHVVQMIDDDIFVTFVKKASFANRAKAARLQLPSTFFAPSSYPPCSGCRGCDDKKTKLEEHVTNMPQQTPARAEGLAAAIGDETNKTTFSIGKENKLLSFADLIGSKKEGKSAFSGGISAKGFMGAGAMLFTSPKKEEGEDPDAFDPQFKPIVALEKRTDLKTGEEGYVDLFKNRAKLFRFDSETKQWKERGVGEIKLSRNPETDYCRVLMRRDIVLKLAANHPTMPEIELKPHGTSATAWVWVSGADYADGEPKFEQFAVRFKTKAIADEFKEVFKECQKTIKRYLSDNKLLGSKEEQKEFRKTEECDVKQSKEQAKMLDRPSLPSKDVHSNQGETLPSGVKKDQPKDVKVSLLSKFKLENMWECPTCMIPNRNDDVKCVSCSTANPNAKPGAIASKPPVFGQQQKSSEKPAGTNIWEKFKTTEGSWECPTCMVPNKNDDVKCVSCSTANPNAKHDASVSKPPVFGQQQKSSDKPAGTNIWARFKTTVGSWECPTCMVPNKNDDVKCVSCSTANPNAKPGASVSKPPVFGQQQKSSEKPAGTNIWEKFKTTEGSWECPTCMVPNKNDDVKCVSCSTANPNAKHGVSVSKPPVFGQQQKSSDKPAGTNIWAKFKTTVGSWECPTCMVPNKNDDVKCLSCSTANPNAKPGASVSKPPVFGQQQMSSEKPDGTNIWAKFKTTEGSWECQTCMVPNKNDDVKCVSCSTANPNAKPAPSGFSFSATDTFSNPESKPGIFTAPPFGQVKGLALFGNQGNPFSNPGFSTSAPAFPAPSFQMPSFKMPSFQVPSSIADKDQCDEQSSANESSNSNHWECPTCSVKNSLTAKTCEGCKTESPSTPKDSVSPKITLRRSPLDSSIKAFSSFAPKQGSWECSSCAVTNDEDKTECKACTASRTGGTSASPKPVPPYESPLTSKTEQNKPFKDFRSLISTPSSFGTAIGENSTPERSLYVTPSEQSSRVDNTEFFTPTGSFFASVQPTGGLFSAKAGGKGIFTASDDTPKNSSALKGNSAPQTPESPVKEDDSNFHCSPVVSLKRVENLETGEEGEVILFSDRAKLYRFDSDTKQWKERGVGLLKILCKEAMAGKYRLIMRRDQVRKLCANHALIPGMCLKIMPSSDKMRIWTTTADIADGEVRKETFAVRFKSHDVLMAFEKEFDKAVEASSRIETEGPTKVQTEKQTSAAKEKEDGKKEIEKKKDIEEVEDFDLKFTKEVLPSDDDQTKAEKLLLPKPFYNAQNGEEDSTNSEKFVETKAEPLKPMLFETFATSKVDEIATRSDVTSVSAPAPSSPEKFQEDCSASFSPIVQLKKIETETGEEGEIVLFSERAKLYRFDGALREWKVRGVGNLRILKNVEKGMTRLIMRRDHVKKVCLNHSVVAGMTLEPMANSKNTLMWFTTADFADGTPKEEKFAAKFQNEEVINEFKRIFNDVAGILDVGEHTIEDDKPKNVDTLGMAIAASSENRPAGKIYEGSAMKEAAASTVQKPAAKSTFMWPVSGGQSLFSFGSGASEESSQEPSADVALEKPSTKESESTQFSWPLSLGGSSTLFSFGLFDKPANTNDEKCSVEAVATQFGTPGNEQSSVPFPFLSTKWDPVEGPLSFASASKEAVEEIPVTSKGLKTNSSFCTFNWGVHSDHQKAETGVIDLEIVKPSQVDNKTAQTPGSPERQLAGEDYMGEVRALVSLTKIESSSGEEHEEMLFDEWAKAYRFDGDAREWKERGRGHVKILMNKRTEQCRILMRRDQVMKIAFNHAFDRNMKLEANSSAKNSWVWFTHADFADEVPKAEKLAVRFRNEVISQKFRACFDDAVNKAKEAGERCPESEALQNYTEDAEKEVVNIDEKTVMKDDEDVVVTYVKEPTGGELMRAKALLLPPTFFAAPTEEENRNRHESSAVQDTAPKSPSTGNAEKLSHGFGLFSGSGVSFSDLVATGDNAFAGFHARTNDQQAFKGQGTALFAGTEKTEHEDGAEEAQGLADFKPIVSLEMKETQTGEEEEEAIFAERCKLYRLDRDLNQWKERGVGDLKILVKKNDNKSRIVMRRDVVFKLGANHFIQPGMTPSPKQGVETTWTWKTIADIADGEPKDETFTAKFKSAEIGRRFANAVQQCLEKLELSSDHNFEEETRQKPDGNDVTTDQTEDSSQSGDTSLNVSNAVSGKETEDLGPKGDQIGTQHTFGGGFSGLDFSALASNKDSGFKKEDQGWFANAGAKLFDGAKNNTSQTEEEHDAHFEPIVQLKQVEVKSGEEDEAIFFEERVKMYRFSHETNQWKERGTGKLKILRNEATGKVRLLMRRDVVLKIGANHALTEGMKLDEMKMAPRSLMWKTTGDTSDGPPAEALFAARFRTDEILVEFRRIFEAICEGEEIVAKRPVTEGDSRDTESQPVVGSCSPAISQALHDFLDKK